VDRDARERGGVRRISRALASRDEWFYLACRRDDDAIVGFLNISEIVRGKLQSGFLGYGAVAQFAGHGYLGEAMELLLREAFIRLRLHRLEANIQPGNVASIALAERCGFLYEGFSTRYLKVGGRWRDHERWAITKEAWLARRRAAARIGADSG
jgi:ribosomal-protein-alanine N-acetyltransferase